MFKLHLRFVIVAICGCALLASGLSSVLSQGKAGFTPTYRAWPRVASAYIGDNKAFTDAKLNPAKADFTGFMNVYANQAAFANYLNGKKDAFPEGSVIVAEFSKADNITGTTVNVEHAGPTNFTAWMIKDSTQSKEQGGWRWELWTLDKDGKDVDAKLDAKTQVAACVTCHQQFLKGAAVKTDLVFTGFTDTSHLAAYQSMMKAMMGGTAEPTVSGTMAATKAK